MERNGITRESITQGTAKFLEARALGDLTVDALSRSMRMSKSSLYKFYASKDDLMVALVEGLCAEAVDEIAVARGRFDALVHALVAHLARVPRALVGGRDRLDPASRARLEAVDDAFSVAFAECPLSGGPGAGVAVVAAAGAVALANARDEIPGDRGELIREVVLRFRR
ncbi:MAG: TetR family transcriptional regulator [Deltaproteobacteria bacterium]|nr:TetR family transcriptional regulator [Deltaproteobacteria bacterium]